MNYKIDNMLISSFGAIPSPNNGHFALSGMLDLPKRIGTTEYGWGTKIEPFVDAEDIELDGRTLTLNVAIKKEHLQAFRNACIACRELRMMDDDYKGRNLLKKYNDGYVSNNASREIHVEGGIIYWKQLTSVTGPLTLNLYHVDPVLDDFTLSYKTTAPRNLDRPFLHQAGTTFYYASIKVLEMEGYRVLEKKYKRILTAPSLSFYGNTPADPVEEFAYWDMKLEYGVNATPYTPAPEEVFFPIPVIQKDEIKVQNTADYCIVSVPFWQNNFELKPVAIIPSGTGEYMIDNYNLVKDLGVYISESNNLRNTAKRIEIQTTEFYQKTQYRGLVSIDLSCAMRGVNFTDIYNKMTQFQSVLMAPGLRTLKIRDNTFSVYFKDGMTVNIVTSNIAKFNLKATVV